MFRSQRGPDPFVGEGRLESLLHGPFRRFVLSLPLSPPSAFYDSFLFIVEPESLVHNGPVRGMRASNRCSSPSSWSLHPCLAASFFPSSRRETTRESSLSTAGERDGWADRDEKSTLPPPSLSFFRFSGS